MRWLHAVSNALPLRRRHAISTHSAPHLVSGGADSPRIIYLKKSTSTGLYYVGSFANLYVDIRAPIDPDVETFSPNPDDYPQGTLGPAW